MTIVYVNMIIFNIDIYEYKRYNVIKIIILLYYFIIYSFTLSATHIQQRINYFLS